VADNDREARRLRDDVLATMKEVYETKSILRMHLAAVDAKAERMIKQADNNESFSPVEEELYKERTKILVALEQEEETLRIWIAEQAAHEGKSGWWPNESARAQSLIRLDRISRISRSIDSLLNQSKNIGRDQVGTKGNERELTETKGNEREVKETKGSERELTETKGSERELTETKGNERELTETKGSVREGRGTDYSKQAGRQQPENKSNQ